MHPVDGEARGNARRKTSGKVHEVSRAPLWKEPSGSTRRTVRDREASVMMGEEVAAAQLVGDNQDLNRPGSGGPGKGVATRGLGRMDSDWCWLERGLGAADRVGVGALAQAS